MSYYNTRVYDRTYYNILATIKKIGKQINYVTSCTQLVSNYKLIVTNKNV